MKPLLIALTVLASFFTQPTFAGNNVTPAVIKSFNATFTTAKDVEWSISDNMYKARFDMSGQVVTAYYSTDGNLVAVTRNITSHQLPLALQTSLKKDHPDFWIADLFELNNESGTTYYVTLESAAQKVVLQSAQNSWMHYSKTKKD